MDSAFCVRFKVLMSQAPCNSKKFCLLISVALMICLFLLIQQDDKYISKAFPKPTHKSPFTTEVQEDQVSSVRESLNKEKDNLEKSKNKEIQDNEEDFQNKLKEKDQEIADLHESLESKQQEYQQKIDDLEAAHQLQLEGKTEAFDALKLEFEEKISDLEKLIEVSKDTSSSLESLKECQEQRAEIKKEQRNEISDLKHELTTTRRNHENEIRDKNKEFQSLEREKERELRQKDREIEDLEKAKDKERNVLEDEKNAEIHEKDVEIEKLKKTCS